MHRLVTGLVLAISVLPAAAHAGDLAASGDRVVTPPKEPAHSRPLPHLTDPRQRQAWLKKRVLPLAKNDQQRRELAARIDRVSPSDLDHLILAFQQRDEGSARARETGGNAADRPVGFQPVIAWLPQGASLGASAVVSPDRRYVRIGAAPFFSRVGSVQNFTFARGHAHSPHFHGPFAPGLFRPHGRVVGYQPVVGWFPQGASLSVGAVVSPDRRYVRINATPFFSRVGGISPWRLP